MDHSVGCSLQVVQERRLAGCGVASSFPQPFSWDLSQRIECRISQMEKVWGCLGDEGMAKGHCPGVTNNLEVLGVRGRDRVFAGSISCVSLYSC